MGLSDRLASERPNRARGLKFADVVAGMPPPDRDALLAAAADPQWSTAALWNVLRKEGFVVGRDQLRRWRSDVAGI